MPGKNLKLVYQNDFACTLLWGRDSLKILDKPLAKKWSFKVVAFSDFIDFVFQH